MFSIYLLDSSKLFQWDLNRKIKIIGKEEVDEVHFSHIGDEEALVVKPIKENNILIANIPNILLQESKDIFVYLVSKDKTLKETFFTVGRREKPSDYVYTETEIKRYETLEERISALEKNGGGGNCVAVDAVLYTKQELTDEEKAQARANINKYIWRECSDSWGNYIYAILNDSVDYDIVKTIPNVSGNSQLNALEDIVSYLYYAGFYNAEPPLDMARTISLNYNAIFDGNAIRERQIHIATSLDGESLNASIVVKTDSSYNNTHLIYYRWEGSSTYIYYNIDTDKITKWSSTYDSVTKLLSVSGKAADAKVVGDKFKELEEKFSEDDVFTVNVTYDNGTFSADKTFDEAKNYYLNNGNFTLMLEGNGIFDTIIESANKLYFYRHTLALNNKVDTPNVFVNRLIWNSDNSIEFDSFFNVYLLHKHGINNDLKTVNKTIIGALNELHSGLEDNISSPISTLPILEESYNETADKLTLTVNVDELQNNMVYKAIYEPHQTVLVKYVFVCEDDTRKTVIAADNAFNIVQITRNDTQGFISLVFDNVVYKVNYGDKSTADVVTVEKLQNQKYLGINNSTEFIPTSDYQPVTKKYVDDECSRLSEEISDLKENGGGGGTAEESDPTVPAWAKQPTKPTYTASEVGARPNTWTPSPSDVGADASGTAENKVSAHNISEDSHNDIRLLIAGLTTRLNALSDSEDVDLDQLSELVAYIKSNRSLIEGITTNKVNVTDIIDNLTTNVSNKPLSAKQGVELKKLINAITIPTTLPNPNKLILTGAVEVEYDGSEEKTVKIPVIDGEDGIGIESVVQTTTSDEDGGVNVITVTKTDGTKSTFQVKNGSKGSKGDKGATGNKGDTGEKGYTPQKGVDYFTAEDEAKIVAETVAEVNSKGIQQTPLFAESLDWLNENTETDLVDTSKVYVLPNGDIAGYTHTTSSGIAYTNVLKKDDGTLDLQINKRWSRSGGAYSDANGFVSTAKIPVKVGQTIRVNRALKFLKSGYARIHYFSSSGECLSSDGVPETYYKLTESNNQTSWIVGQNTSGSNYSWAKNITTMIVIFNVSEGTATTMSAVADLILTIDEPIEESVVEGYQWTLTGRNIAPPDYEERIIELETEVEVLKDELEKTFIKKNLLGIIEVFAPSPQLPADGSENADFNANKGAINCNQIYDYLDALVSKYPRYITKEVVGKDASDTYDWCRYVCSKRHYDAWVKTNYPPMYAWTNGNTSIYSRSVSPRIGDTMYSTAYIGTAYSTVTAVNNAEQTRTVNGLVFTRNSSKDVEPTLVYTETAYSPYYIGVYAGHKNGVYDSNKSKISTISTCDELTMKDANGNTYNRYPLGDRNRKFSNIPSIVIGGSEHGSGEPTEPAIIASRMAKDLCECVNASNPFLNLLKNNYMIVFCPIINPWDFSRTNANGWNANGVNLDRNYDTIGWGNDPNTQDVHGAYGGSEAETQHFMNTLVESKTKIALANHALGNGTDSGEGISAGFCHYMLGRDNAKYADSIKSIGEIMSANYNLSFTDYGQAPPETWGKTRSYIASIGAEGGALEMQSREGFIKAGNGEEHTAKIMEANYTLLLQFLYMLIDKQD